MPSLGKLGFYPSNIYIVQSCTDAFMQDGTTIDRTTRGNPHFWHVLSLYESSELTAASTFAGESLFGSASMEITLIMMVSTVWMGSQRSSGFS